MDNGTNFIYVTKYRKFLNFVVDKNWIYYKNNRVLQIYVYGKNCNYTTKIRNILNFVDHKNYIHATKIRVCIVFWPL